MSFDREQVRQYLEKLFGKPVQKRVVTAITVNPRYHGVGKLYIRVGSSCADLEPGAPSEKILGIYESMSFLVVTATRGAGHGMPYIFSRDTIVDVNYSDLSA